MPDLLHVTYAQTGASTTSDRLGMREMQARAYARRNEQYLLIKSPPASGKSRALMFLALDKVHHQGLDKVLIAVPEMSIGSSFRDTDLVSHGFFANWHIEPRYSLCTPGSDSGKVERVLQFLQDRDAHYLLCTHATLRFAWERLKSGSLSCLDKALVAIDEFHHTSEEDGNKLGAMLADVMRRSSAHVVAMTGSYFRGDCVPILSPEAEQKFAVVTYTYYEQLNGYKYLKSLGLGYHFYRGQYLDALADVLDLSKKTIIHIPSVNSRESTKKKLNELDRILDIMGTVESVDQDTGIINVRTRDGRMLKVADLVNDGPKRVDILGYLRGIRNRDDMDIIIALGMAKEGFDWPWCEHVLTVGYRSSLTEVVQIIGRATRDCEGKTHAQFTNLIAQPDADDKDVQTAVNNLLKAISLSLLMRDVLAPNIRFKPRSDMKKGEKPEPDVIVVEDTERPLSPELKKVLEEQGVDMLTEKLVTSAPNNVGLKTAIVSDDQRELFTVGLGKLIRETFSNLTAEDQENLRLLVITKLGLMAAGDDAKPDTDTKQDPKPVLPPIIEIDDKGTGKDKNGRDNTGDGDTTIVRPNTELLKLSDRFLSTDELNIDLIAQINPFHKAYEILSKNMDAPTLKAIQTAVDMSRSTMSEEEALLLWNDVLKFTREHNCPPSNTSTDAYERRLAEALSYVRMRKAQAAARSGDAAAAGEGKA